MHFSWNPSKQSPLVVVLGAFVLLALVYAWATPPLEASDELWHVGMVNAIADTGQLPVQIVGLKTAWEQEGSQPPLYYFISALLVRGIDRSDFDTLRQPNPHAIAGVPGNVGNKNLVLHDTPYPPLERATLAIYILRLFGAILGCVTIFSIYNAAREVQTRYPIALLAAALTAFNPMFLFISASVNNDNLVTALDSLILWQTLVMLRQGFSNRRSLLLAVLLACAALSKLSGLVMYPVVFLAALYLVYTAFRQHSPLRQKVLQSVSLFAIFAAVAGLLIAGWWYLRNLNLYGELFGTRMMVAVAGARQGSFTLSTLLSEFQGFRFGYWAVFGAFNIMTFRWFYDVVDILTIIAALGVVLYLWRYRTKPNNLIRSLLLIITIALGIVGVIGWTAQTYASQGRLLFPYVAAISPLIALGLAEIVKRLSPLVPVYRVLPMAFVLFAFIVPFASIVPEYTLPAPLDHLPDNAQQVYARFGDVALVGYETPDRRYFPGDSVPITVYWQVQNRSTDDLSLYLHATLDDGSVIGKVDSYPGAGRLRTTTWQPGAIYADTYAIPLDEDASGISRLRVQVGWWDYPTGVLLNASDQQGKPLDSVMLDVGGFAPRTRTPMPSDFTAVPSVTFGGLIHLSGYKLDGKSLTLAWASEGALPAADTIFVQVLSADNKVVGQGDAPPDLPTRYWSAGESFLTHHTLVYPAPPPSGQYRLIIGWYNPLDNIRLKTSSPDDAYPLLTLTLP